MKKKTQTNIDLLRNQKRLNVQEQNILTRNSIYNIAFYWRKNNIPLPLIQIFEENNIDRNTSIFIEYEQDYPGTSADWGKVLTSGGKFFEFDMDLNSERSELIQLNVFTDITDQYDISDHKKGIGKSFGFIALEVLNELNSEENEA